MFSPNFFFDSFLIKLNMDCPILLLKLTYTKQPMW